MNRFETITILALTSLSTEAANLVENGSFEQPATGMDTVTGWQSAHNAAGSLLRKKTKSSDGDWSLVVGRNRETGILHGAAIRTEHLVAADDCFELRFDWRPETPREWKRNDFFQYRLFTTENNQSDGKVHMLMTGTSDSRGKRAYSTLRVSSATSIPSDCLGHHLWFEIAAPKSSQESGAVRIDNLQLTTSGASPVVPAQPPEATEPQKQNIPAPRAIPAKPSPSQSESLGLITASTPKPAPERHI